ncbi:MAG: ChaN family lipoprotein [Gammaproteobacteria bacterium]|nr:ChaN family lipoprotein [Gammaproteobacteria bacterium]
MHDSARSSKATSPRCDDPHRALCAPARAALRAGALCLLLAVAAGASSEVLPGDGTSCAASAVESRWRAPRISTADGQTLSLEQLIGRLEAVDVVYIGEQHDRYDHHLHQLELLCRLWQRTPRIALAVEFFQHRFQSAADDFIRRHGDLDRLLLETEYFSRWGHDARLYAPLLEFASRHQIPLVALNADGALVRAVARHGLGSLDESQRRMLPDPLPAPGDTYTQRLAPIFEAHLQHRDGKPAAGQATLEFFVQAQSVWDQTMAQGIVELHRALPEHRIVVIAGNGHVGYDDAIPARVRASSELRAVVLVNAGAGAPAHEFDYQLRG